jgi:hypothetical protein
MTGGFGDGLFGDGTFGGAAVGVDLGTVHLAKRPSLTPLFTIDGRPVRLFDWQCDVSADWGDRSLTGKLPRSVTWAEQGAPVVGWLGSERPLWTGELSQDPRSDGDAWAVKANGPAENLASNRTRLFYRIDDTERWVPSDGEPHNFAPAGGEAYNVDARRNGLYYFLEAEPYLVNDRLGHVLWVEGGNITKMSFKINKVAHAGNFQLLTRVTMGPAGTLATPVDSQSTINLGSGTPDGTLANINMDAGSTQDLIVTYLNCVTGNTVGNRHRYWLTNVKVYGRTTDDAFSASDAASDVAALSGMDTTNVQANGLGILPMDWTDDHPSFLTQLAAICDWRWMARGDGLHFGPYDRTWTVFTNHDAAANLDIEPRANRVIVGYRSISGAYREAIAEPAIDPFPGKEIVHYADELEAAQPDGTLATSVAANQADFWASRRVRGTLELANVRDGRGMRNPYEVVAGDLISLPDTGLPPQRVSTVTYSPGEQVTAEIGLTFNPVRALIEGDRPTRRRKRRRR